MSIFFFFQAEDGIRDDLVTGVQTCALPISLLTQERVDLVAEAIARLPEREKVVITLYYHEELTMKEVGAVLGLTESRVSQLHSQAMLRLKAPLSDHFGDPREQDKR